MNAALLLVGLALGLIAGLCVFALASLERPVEKLRPWRVCWRCGERVGENGNIPQEVRVVCETCTAAALKRVA